MARNTLEAVFGALGAGLTGYGRERREQQEAEEKRRREALQESLQAANMLATGRFGTEAQLRESAGRAFQTAGQMAMGTLPLGQMAMGAERKAGPRIPRMEDISNLSTAARRGPAPPMFDVGGQKLGVLRTQADEERERMLAQTQQAAIDREQRLADEQAKFEREHKGALEIAKLRQTPERDNWVWSDARGVLINKDTGQVKVPEGLPGRPESPSQTAGFGSGLDYSRDIATIEQFFPKERIPVSAGQKAQIDKPDRPLSKTKLFLVKRAAEGDDKSVIALSAAEQAGQDFTNELAYYTTASGIAQAYAIQEQRGRNVSDRDINNRIRQITVQPEEVGNLEVMNLKANRLRQWADLLQNRPNEIPQLPEDATGGSATLQPPRLPASRPNVPAQPAESSSTNFTSADYDAAVAALGTSANAEDYRAWMRKNRRR